METLETDIADELANLAILTKGENTLTMSRQIILDTETTGLDVTRNHKIIEIGCIEIVDRKYTGKKFHEYLNPEREIDQGALSVHGITNESLKDKPFLKI